jgi:tetratricopeptide (TPR) repeat protein
LRRLITIGEAYYNRGLTYAKGKGHYDKAISDFNKAIEITPRVAYIYGDRGLTYVMKGQSDKAISDFNKAIDLNPRYAPAYNNRGFVYYKKGQYNKACSDFKQACEFGACKGFELVKRRGLCK